MMLVVVLTATWAVAAGSSPARRAMVKIGDEVFQLEVATTSEEHSRGLMNRPEIPVDGGMLFVFAEEQVRQFWMAYTLVDLDILFLDSRGRIVAMHEMRAERAQSPAEREVDYFDRLPRYSSSKPAMYAIELRGGTLGALRAKVGDTVELQLDDRAR
ncbi:MAG: hypothetical protein A3K19_00085 [Lentisphaerae bacterium RIFOXYB12_FULL_65_16]|nr:MAG: hypothetical protein A3K18_06735 [Lentisphaerae bacterium RIFOXYA12_64_32]OGV86196.1 MAG: hypothetical protein A3K19_00085 [Lentisphaerae bacterium RIFOXYB12_FULL_65_16]